MFYLCIELYRCTDTINMLLNWLLKLMSRDGCMDVTGMSINMRHVMVEYNIIVAIRFKL